MNPKHKKYEENYIASHIIIKLLKINKRKILTDAGGGEPCYMQRIKDKDDSKFLTGNKGSETTVNQHL